MDIYLNNQAENCLKTNKMKNNSAGIFYSLNDNIYIWWKNTSFGFDAGEEINFNTCYNKIKNK